MKKSILLICAVLVACKLPVSETKAPYLSYGASAGEGSVGVHTVTQGETLWQIAQRYRLPLRDVMDVNPDLAPPYKLSPGIRLKLPPPREYTAQTGDSVSSVALLFSTSPREITAINNLAPPYALRPGQVLRLPSVLRAAPVVAQYDATQIVTPTAPAPDAVEAVPLDMPSAPTSAPQDVAALPQKPATNSPADLPVSSGPALQKTVGATKPVVVKNIPALAGQFIKPVQGPIISGFGPKTGGLHNDGINIRAARGTPVRASENGVVAYVGSEIEGFGNMILIKHQDRYITAYAHLEKTLTKRGDKVARGQTIGTVGSTGNAETPQLHFEIRKGRDPINPSGLLGS